MTIPISSQCFWSSQFQIQGCCTLLLGNRVSVSPCARCCCVACVLHLRQPWRDHVREKLTLWSFRVRMVRLWVPWMLIGDVRATRAILDVRGRNIIEWMEVSELESVIDNVDFFFLLSREAVPSFLCEQDEYRGCSMLRGLLYFKMATLCFFSIYYFFISVLSTTGLLGRLTKRLSSKCAGLWALSFDAMTRVITPFPSMTKLLVHHILCEIMWV